MKCAVLQDHDGRWDSFVENHPAGTFFHLSIWREIISRSFGHEAIYLYAEEGGEWSGVLPLFLVKSWIFGKSLVAVPVGVYGGIVAESERASELLLDRATQLAEDHGVRYLELRGNPYAPPAPTEPVDDIRPRWSRKDLYVTFLSEMEPTEEANMARIPRKQRRMVRQGAKHGLRAVFDNGRLREFYDVYAASVRHLGTPVYGFDYFENLVELLGEQCKILVVEHEGRVVSGVLSFFYKDQVLPYYAGALKQYLHLAPNDFMYWELMRYAVARGCKVFDFGRSKKGTGSYDFKRHWGFEPRPLPYWCYTSNGQRAPDTSPLNPKLRWAVRIWRGLPLRLTKLMGPHIVKHIP
ncbi:MAG TPA: FemAB family XrtA/PEP-CTERM system-associated protein [Candidatus Binatia bacterium]|nr:FemAB family XrtA/PEP-CTERM system-associated protein [Candidatus Binatia bacterium]